MGFGGNRQGRALLRNRRIRHLRQLHLPLGIHPPFLNADSLSSPSRKLSVVCDVSCDTTNPHNPVPIYNENSTFSRPTLPVVGYENPPLSVISIDHLPSLLPRESSEAFSEALLPSLLELRERKDSRVWKQAETLFEERVGTLPESLRGAWKKVTGQS